LARAGRAVQAVIVALLRPLPRQRRIVGQQKFATRNLLPLGIIRRQGLQNTLISYLGVAVGFANNVFLFTHFLSKSELGLTRLLVQVGVLVALPAAVGLPNVTARFFPRFRDKANRHGGFLWLLLVVPTTLYALVLAVLFLCKTTILGFYDGHSVLLPRYYDWLAVIGFGFLIYNLLDAYQRSLYKTVVSSLIQDVLLRLGTAASVGVYALDWVNFDQFVALYVGVNALATLGMVVYTAWLGQLFVWPDWRAFRPAGRLWEMIRYGLFSVLGNLSNTVIATVDSLMILRFESDAQVGIYTTAFFVTSVLLVPARSLYKIATPQVSDCWNSHDLPKLADLYRRISLLNLTAGGFLFAGLWANVDVLFRLLPPGYDAGRYVILLMGLGRLFDMATGINGVILNTSARYRWDLGFNIALGVLTVLSCLYFVPRYGITGAAFASALTLVAVNAGRLAGVWYWFGMQPFTRRTLLVLGIIGVAYACGAALPSLGSPWLDLGARGTVITLVYGGLLLGTRAVPDVGVLVGGVLKRVRK
jgi:O-antigen/teichoic acid export membrane protein